MFLSSLFADSRPASPFTEDHPVAYYGPWVQFSFIGLGFVSCPLTIVGFHPLNANDQQMPLPSGFIIHILPWSHAYCYCYPTLIISHVFLLAHDALKYFLIYYLEF